MVSGVLVGAGVEAFGVLGLFGLAIALTNLLPLHLLHNRMLRLMLPHKPQKLGDFCVASLDRKRPGYF
jgi:hypothetical protein